MPAISLIRLMSAAARNPLQRSRAVFAAFVLAATLAGCGFQLRGQSNLPFETIHVPGGSVMVVELRRNITSGSQTRVIDQPKEADAVFALTQEVREKVILSLDTAGRVREYQLRYRVGFHVHNGKGANWIPASEITLTRDISFNDAQIIAKEAEEALLYRDMQTDMVQQIVRRLARAKLTAAVQ
jgi:LPS-assembly lipoprotein